jgi:hypothetical protein
MGIQIRSAQACLKAIRNPWEFYVGLMMTGQGTLSVMCIKYMNSKASCEKEGISAGDDGGASHSK